MMSAPSLPWLPEPEAELSPLSPSAALLAQLLGLPCQAKAAPQVSPSAALLQKLLEEPKKKERSAGEEKAEELLQRFLEAPKAFEGVWPGEGGWQDEGDWQEGPEWREEQCCGCWQEPAEERAASPLQDRHADCAWIDEQWQNEESPEEPEGSPGLLLQDCSPAESWQGDEDFPSLPPLPLQSVEAGEPPLPPAARGRAWCHFFLDEEMLRHKAFGVCQRVIGRGGEHTRAIFERTGAKVRLRGRGSGHLEHGGREASAHLMLAVGTPGKRDEGFREALEMALELLQGLSKDFADFRARRRLAPPARGCFWLGELSERAKARAGPELLARLGAL